MGSEDIGIERGGKNAGQISSGESPRIVVVMVVCSPSFLPGSR